MKVFLGVFIFLFLLSSCGKEEVSPEVQKQDFFIETKLWEDFSGGISLEKSWKVRSSQDIQLSAQAAWRVSSVLVKAGDSVTAGQPIVLLEDTLWSYGINLQRAANGVERAQINYDSTKLQLEKQIFDTKVNIEKLERNLETARKDSEQSIKQAGDTLSNSQYENLDSKSALQIEQLDNNIKKAELDFENKKIADVETIQSFKTSLKKDANTLIITLDDIIQFSDEILGVTDLNKYKNEDIQQFLGVKDLTLKEETKRNLIDLIAFRKSIELQNSMEKITAENLSEEEIIEVIDLINAGYEKTKTLLNNLEQTLNSSLESVGILGPVEISAFVWQINGYQASLQWSYAGFLAFGNQAKSFLRTYKNTQTSIQQSLDLQKKDREIQLKSLASGELSASVWLEKTILGTQNTIADIQDQIILLKNTLETTQKNYEITLRSLDNAIREAQIAYASAQKEFAKLTITSPINGTIAQVYIDKGQEVAPGVKISDIVSDNTPEVQIALSEKEKNLVTLGQKVFLDVGKERITGSIYALSDVADTNLNYIATVVFESGTNILWSIVTVQVPLQTEKKLLPLESMQTQGTGNAKITLYTGTGFVEASVVLWEIFWEYAEVISCGDMTLTCQNQKVVLGDISNYDAQKFTIKEKNNTWNQ